MRKFTMMCLGCGWTLELPVVNDHMDITALEGWTMDDEQPPLCERCSTGWRPTARLHPPVTSDRSAQSVEPGEGDRG